MSCDFCGSKACGKLGTNLCSKVSGIRKLPVEGQLRPFTGVGKCDISSEAGPFTVLKRREMASEAVHGTERSVGWSLKMAGLITESRCF